MSRKYVLLFVLSYFSIAIVSPIHPSSIIKTKAEDIDSSLPTVQSTLFSSCDLTYQFCDINCCIDQDCSVQDIKSFICSYEEYSEKRLFTHLDCENIGSLESVASPLLCLQHHNSPYLGDFYLEEENLSVHNFVQILALRNKAISGFRAVSLASSNSDDKYYNRGSIIYFYDTKGYSHNLDILSNILSPGNGYCSKVPLRFLINRRSNCFFLMNEEQCLLNEEFHLQHHLNSLKRVEYLGEISNVNVFYQIICLRDGTSYVSFLKSMFKSKVETFTNDDVTECKSDLSTRISKSQTVCENVVVGLNYNIYINGTVIKSINVTVFTTDIPFNIKGFVFLKNEIFNPLNKLVKEVIYGLQKVIVTFIDIDSVSSKLGYATGQPIFSE